MLVASGRAASAFLTHRSAATRRLTGHPRKAKSSTEINSGDLTESIKKKTLKRLAGRTFLPASLFLI
jgi:hypothetical protein